MSSFLPLACRETLFNLVSSKRGRAESGTIAQLRFGSVEGGRSHNGIRIRLYNKHHMQEAAWSFAGSWAPRAGTVSEISRKRGQWIHLEWKWDTECPTLASLTIGLRWFPVSRHRLHRVTDAVCAQRTLEYCYRQLPTSPVISIIRY